MKTQMTGRTLGWDSREDDAGASLQGLTEFQVGTLTSQQLPNPFGHKDTRYFIEGVEVQPGTVQPAKTTKAYNPDQPRGADGKWGDDNGESSRTESRHIDPSAVHVLGTGGIHLSVTDYLINNGGKEYEGRPLPKNIKQGTPNECYANAGKLVMDNHMMGDGKLNYCEGFAVLKDDPTGILGIMHGWAVDEKGNVIDNTLTDSQNWRYFGIKYDYEALVSHMLDTGYFGVLGGDSADAMRVMKNGGL